MGTGTQKNSIEAWEREQDVRDMAARDFHIQMLKRIEDRAWARGLIQRRAVITAAQWRQLEAELGPRRMRAIFGG